MTTSTPVGHCDAGRNEWLESRMMRNVSSPVRRGADGKGPGHRNLASRLPYNLLAQLHGGVRALAAPVNTLESNGAWMVMTALAWTLKAWWALMLPESPGRWQEQHREEKNRVLRQEFKAFVNAFVTIPCQVLRTGGRLVLRVLGWNPSLMTFFRLVSRLRQ